MSASFGGTQQEHLVLEMPTAKRLSEASRRVGSVESLVRIWPAWENFAGLPLTSVASLNEVELRGQELDLARLLALGPKPDTSRPELSLRWAVGVSLALRRLKSWSLSQAITPSLVTFIYETVDAPQLSRGMRSDLSGLKEQAANPVPGSAIWSQAPQWVQQGMPRAWAAGLALAMWERDGPPGERRSVTGRVLMHALAPRLGMEPAAFTFLAPALVRAAESMANGWKPLIKKVRTQGSWRRFVEVFLAALAISSARVCDLSVSAEALHRDHAGLVKSWVRAPRHPLRLLDLILHRPVLDLPAVAKELDVTQRTAGLLVNKLMEIDLLTEITGQRRGRKFAYVPLMELLQPGWGWEEEE